ncbi:hypothetical protein CHARACLAT_032360 [Characodon lateralis]|uniref:Uncharacterized protein n=1 Tax=Characodon lateralis TaxID=208331 RepID=A0ABU7CW54_9TELE|nr:hypothetical protein [Characodon lateralis]
MKMLLTLLMTILEILVQGSSGDIILTQSPGSQSVAPGQTVTISCEASSSAGTCLNWLKDKQRLDMNLLDCIANLLRGQC